MTRKRSADWGTTEVTRIWIETALPALRGRALRAPISRAAGSALPHVLCCVAIARRVAHCTNNLGRASGSYAAISRLWSTLAGVRVALTTAAMPVPVRVTGEPVTVTFAVMVNVPFAAPGGAIARIPR